jgi:hypothetical protein
MRMGGKGAIRNLIKKFSIERIERSGGCNGVYKRRERMSRGSEGGIEIDEVKEIVN